MIKTTAAAIFTAAGLSCCQAPAQQPAPTPAPAKQCIVWANEGQVPNVEPPCQLNIVFPTHAEAKANCDQMGGRLGQLIGTCYDVDF
jgi:hypothetical protein